MLSQDEVDFMYSNFFGAYFNQDWMRESSIPSEIVKNYAEVSGQEGITKTVQILEKLLQEVQDDDELEELVFNQFQCCYDPTPDGKSVREWLTDVHHQLLNTNLE